MKHHVRCWMAVIFVIAFGAATTFAAHKDDLVVLKNGDRLTGEIKGLQRGELKIKADYMAEAVRLDWARIERLESKSTFIVSLVNGQLFTNVIRLLPSGSVEVPNFVIGNSDKPFKVPQLDVLRIVPVDPGFFKRLEGSIDFGFSFTSGNDQYQTQLTATTTYRTGDHSFTTSIDSAFSGQPDADSTTRNQFTFDYRKQLTPRWFAGGLFELLQSDQQSLKLRTSVGGLIGRNFYQTQLTATTTYRTGDHSFTTSIDSAFSGQPDADSTTRNQFTFDYRKQLTPRWFAGGLFELLQSDQQSLKLRTSVGGLIGRNFYQTEHSRLSIFGGIAGTRENYSTSIGQPNTTNADALAGVDFTTFRFKTTDIRTRVSLFPSLTTPGRMRLQASSDLHIKIVKDLYWGFHLYESFDSKPPVSANKNDLGISTSLGWKF